MSTSSLGGRKPVCPKPSSHSEQTSRVRRFLGSSARRPMSVLKSSSASPMRSKRRSRNYSFPSAPSASTMGSSLVVLSPPAKTSLMLVRSWQPSTRQPGGPQGARSSGSVAQDGAQYRVELHPQVAKIVAAHGGAGASVFRPSIGDLIDELEVDPKRYPKKHGKLKSARAAPLRYMQNVTWRAVYTIDEDARVVLILGLGPHDQAYDDAERRI